MEGIDKGGGASRKVQLLFEYQARINKRRKHGHIYGFDCGNGRIWKFLCRFGSLADFAYQIDDPRRRLFINEKRTENDLKFFVPPILNDNEELVKEWIEDCKKQAALGIKPQNIFDDLCLKLIK